MTGYAAHPGRRVAVVAGASAGIGAATARALAAAGFPVALGARRVERCAELAAELRADGAEAVAHPLDVTDDASVAAFAEHVGRDLGAVEVVVASAAVVAPGRTWEVATDRFARELDVNLLGVHRLVRAFVPGMVARGRGDLVAISSDVAVQPRPSTGAYTASKQGLEGMLGALRLELEGTGVRASVVRPGPTLSEMGADWDADEGARVLTEWARFGLARHPGFLPASAVADAVLAVVSAPRGVHLGPVDVAPEAAAPARTHPEEVR